MKISFKRRPAWVQEAKPTLYVPKTHAEGNMVVSTFREVHINPRKHLERLANKIGRIIKFRYYRFASIGNDVFIHPSCEVASETAMYICIGNNVKIEKDVWINIEDPHGQQPLLILADGCRLNRRCMISAKNHIYIGRNVIFGASVLLMDHNHAYEDVNVPIIHQGVTPGGSIRIEDGCWIGFGAAIVSNENNIVIGRNSVIGANSVVSKSIPPYSVVSGNPGRVVRQYDPAKEQWVMGSSNYRSAKLSAEEEG